MSAALLSHPIVLTEGAVIERLRRDPATLLDPHVVHAAFLYSPLLRRALSAIYSEYLDIGRASGLPMLVFTPTWRAHPERLALAGLAARDVNGDGVRYLAELRASCGDAAGRVGIGALLGCRGDAYRPEEALPAREAARFHAAHVRLLAAARPDFLYGSTLPAACEAEGIAAAMAASGLPYLLSFIIGADGALLDGTPLADAILRIDAAVSPAPFAYMINCVHPANLRGALARASLPPGRLAGLQGNTSRRSPAELEGLPELDTEDPGAFARETLRLHTEHGLRILGGCCGTDHRHIQALARLLVR